MYVTRQGLASSCDSLCTVATPLLPAYHPVMREALSGWFTSIEAVFRLTKAASPVEELKEHVPNKRNICP